MKRFSDFSNEKVLDGDKIAMSDILNQEIEVIGYNIKNSRYSKNKNGDYLTLQIRKAEKKHVIFTGSDVLIDQIKKYCANIPFLTTIRKINNYYSFT